MGSIGFRFIVTLCNDAGIFGTASCWFSDLRIHSLYWNTLKQFFIRHTPYECGCHTHTVENVLVSHQILIEVHLWIVLGPPDQNVVDRYDDC